MGGKEIYYIEAMKRVLGIGNALVDILIRIVNDDFLAWNNLPKGSMQLIEKEFGDKLLFDSQHWPRQITCGGSAANTIHGLGKMGLPVSYIGTIGNDDFGNIFEESLKWANIKPSLKRTTEPTGRAIALISPDSERTFATFLGAALLLTEKDIHAADFEGHDYIHIEGYLLQNHKLVEKVFEIAKQKNIKISLDLASYNVVEANLKFLNEIIPGNVSILFANEEESKALTGLDPNEAVFKMSEDVDIAVVKLGSKGSIIKKSENFCRVNANKVNCIDTTGAGDLYASGFLYGLAQDFALCKCGELGSLISSKVVEVIGAKIPDQEWTRIKDSIEETILR